MDPHQRRFPGRIQVGGLLVGRATDAAPAGVELKLPGGDWTPVRFKTQTDRSGIVEFGPETIGPLTLKWTVTQKTPSLVERTLEVHAKAAQRFAIAFPLDLAFAGEFASFSGPITKRVLCDTVRGAEQTETFPVGMVRSSGKVFGIEADSPGLWENRCQVLVDPGSRRLAVFAGDGRDPYPLVIKPPEDARDTYQYEMDGWQSLAVGETRRFTTWVFASPARNHYDAQVAAHIAVANAKGWNSSILEAILRNTSLFLLRRNLARDADNRPRDGRYIFVSGPGYGWKQWVSDGFYTALGLDDPEKTTEAHKAVFWTRMDYEDNAQYYLIWAALIKRAGGAVNESLVRKAYAFIREHEKDGLYVPPPLPGAPNPKGWKTYHDVLPYDDDDSPASNQGFHCGALLAAKELGLDVTDADIEKAIAAYRSLFNAELGFMPTSRKQRDILGQTGEDPVNRAIDARLNVIRENGYPRLEPDALANVRSDDLFPPVTATGEPPDTNYDESRVPYYKLPDLLVCMNGQRVSDLATWRDVRRPEILNAFARNVYGRTPPIRTNLRFQPLAPDAEVFGGLATRRQVRIRLLDDQNAPWIDLLLFIPKQAGKRVPAFLGLNYGNQGVHPDSGIVPSRNSICQRGEHAHRWPLELILKRGYAVASFHGGDIELDRHGSGCRFTPESWRNGIRFRVLAESGRARFDDDDDWGSIGAWAWGLSRALDYLQTDPAIDGRRVAVFGHSRTGKTALWAGAQDERFALVISNDSGQGGAAIARRRYGETVAASYALSGIWYCRNYGRYANNEDQLPVDAHMLIALIAPRPVYVASAELDRWADPRGEFLAALHAEPVYALYGLKGLGVSNMPEVNSPVGHTIGYHIRTGDHEITPYDWERYLDFAGRHLR